MLNCFKMRAQAKQTEIYQTLVAHYSFDNTTRDHHWPMAAHFKSITWPTVFACSSSGSSCGFNSPQLNASPRTAALPMARFVRACKRASDISRSCRASGRPCPRSTAAQSLLPAVSAVDVSRCSSASPVGMPAICAVCGVTWR
jgi:hypothetical protein